VGSRTVAVIDPGPDVELHVRALASALRDADEVVLLLTHGHADHAGAVAALTTEVEATVAGPSGLTGVDRVLTGGDSVTTDEGSLLAVPTPGHTPEHLCYHWPDRGALFAGDHLLGSGDTTWVAEYPGCVADYLASLDRLRTLDLDVIYPAHGPPIEDPAGALDRYERHRRERIRQVDEALAGHPDASPEELLDLVYGLTVPASMRGAALRSLEALIDHVEAARA
jgi:glyoxylase-like metal-dependent hydrolase (beta-lactamase superfamily II)